MISLHVHVHVYTCMCITHSLCKCSLSLSVSLDFYRSRQSDGGTTAVCMYDTTFTWRNGDGQVSVESGIGSEREGEREGKGEGEKKEERREVLQWTLNNVSLNIPPVSRGGDSANILRCMC